MTVFGFGSRLLQIRFSPFRSLMRIENRIKTIMQARKVLVVANGLAKAKAVKAVVSGPVTPECPGSILQMHPDCILVADEEALSLL